MPYLLTWNRTLAVQRLVVALVLCPTENKEENYHLHKTKRK